MSAPHKKNVDRANLCLHLPVGIRREAKAKRYRGDEHAHVAINLMTRFVTFGVGQTKRSIQANNLNELMYCTKNSHDGGKYHVQLRLSYT